VKKTIWARVSPDIDKSARMLAKAMGISISEYVRRLIIEDLDSRKLLDLEKSMRKRNDASK